MPVFWIYAKCDILIECLHSRSDRFVFAFSHIVIFNIQRAKKVVSDSPGLVDFAFGLVNSVLNLSDGQVNFFGKFKLQKDGN